MRTSGYIDIHRKATAAKTTESWTSTPHVSYVYETDITDLYQRFRSGRQRNQNTLRLTFNTVVMKLLAEALLAAPELNAAFCYDKRKAEGRYTVLPSIHIALPWMTKDGHMITPTVYDCEDKSLWELQAAIDEVRTRVDATDVDALMWATAKQETGGHLSRLELGYVRRLLAATLSLHPTPHPDRATMDRYQAAVRRGEQIGPRDILGATVTVSNIGSLLAGSRGHFAMLQLIEPQVVVFGVNPLRSETLVSYDGQGSVVEAKKTEVLSITIVFDHRALDFSDIVPLIRKLDELCSSSELTARWFEFETA